MNTWLHRLGMSLIVTLGFTIGKVPAQAPVVPTSPGPDWSPSSPLSQVIARPPQPALPVKYPCLNAHGFGCAGDPNWFGCGNWLVQTRFAFGSCRYFFTEPCVPKLQGVNNHAIP